MNIQIKYAYLINAKTSFFPLETYLLLKLNMLAVTSMTIVRINILAPKPIYSCTMLTHTICAFSFVQAVISHTLTTEIMLSTFTGHATKHVSACQKL